MPSSLPQIRLNERPCPRLHYAGALPADTAQVLGVIGFGAGRPAGFAGPFIQAPLNPAAGAAQYEIWTADGPVRHWQVGPVAGACGAGLAFGCVRLDERAGLTLEEAAAQAYLAIFAFLDETGFSQPIRFWNYLTAILDDDAGMERYRRFNVGRHRAFMARLTQTVPPAASCVGGHGDGSVVYFLAAREAAVPVENPRQVSAYDYPVQYGPRSPSFSRAGVFGEALFISGTASIVGHETRHCGDLRAQIAETLENLRALIAHAGRSAALVDSAGWSLKVYLHEPAYRGAVEDALTAMFGVESSRLYLHGEVCRADLLVEIEAFYRAG